MRISQEILAYQQHIQPIDVNRLADHHSTVWTDHIRLRHKVLADIISCPALIHYTRCSAAFRGDYNKFSRVTFAFNQLCEYGFMLIANAN